MAVNPAVIAGGASVIGSLAESVLNSRDPERIKRLIAFLRSRIGQGGIPQPEQARLSQQIFRSGSAARGRSTEAVNRRLGLESGFAQGEILRNLESDRFGASRDIALQSQRQGFQSDQANLALIARLEQAIL